MFVKIESDLISIERNWAYDLNFCEGRLRKNFRLTFEPLSTSFILLGRLSFKLEWWVFHRRGLNFDVVFSNNDVLTSFPWALIHGFIWSGLSIVLGEFIGEQVELVLADECLGRGVVDAEHCGCLHKNNVYFLNGHLFVDDFFKKLEFGLHRDFSIFVSAAI